LLRYAARTTISIPNADYSGAEEHFTHEKVGFQKSFYDLANNTVETIAPQRSAVGVQCPTCGPFGNGTYSVYLYGNETVRLLDAHAAEHRVNQRALAATGDAPTAMQPLYFYLAWNVVHDPNEAPYVTSLDHPPESNAAALLRRCRVLSSAAYPPIPRHYPPTPPPALLSVGRQAPVLGGERGH
jgi:hypothetical protein